MKRLPFLILLMSLPLVAQEPIPRFANLTLEEAQVQAERSHPQLAAARARVEAASGRVQQAGAFPNPELIVGAEQLPLRGGAPNDREFVAGVGQPVPLGKRLSKARAVEQSQAEAREHETEAIRRELRRRVHSAFATALYGEQAVETRRRLQEDVERLAATVQARVDAGDATADELARVLMESAQARLEFERAGNLRQQSFTALAAAMGNARGQIDSLSGNLEAIWEMPALEALAQSLAEQPELLLAEANLRASEARVELTRAERIPDVRIEALYHRLESTKENTFDLGFSLPLPLFNRNEGRLREARAELAAAQAQARSTENTLRLDLAEAQAALAGALAASRMLKTEILPLAETVLKTTEARFAAGDINLREALLVRRDWVSAQLQYLESLRDVMLAWSKVRSFMPQIR